MFNWNLKTGILYTTIYKNFPYVKYMDVICSTSYTVLNARNADIDVSNKWIMFTKFICGISFCCYQYQDFDIFFLNKSLYTSVSHKYLYMIQ